MKLEIEVVSVYRIKKDSSRKTYRTYEGVIRHLAWKLISNKYWGHMTYSNASNYDDFGFPLEKLPGNLECYCVTEADLREEGSYSETWDCCPIHDRETGYLRRLNGRLVRYLLAYYPQMPRLATSSNTASTQTGLAPEGEQRELFK